VANEQQTMVARAEAPHTGSRSARSLGAWRGAPWTLLIVAGVLCLAVPVLGLGIVVNAISLAIQAVFFLFFIRHFAFAVSAMDSAQTDLVVSDLDTGFKPTVSVLVPCKDEEEVLDNLLASLLALDYPHDRLELVIVDDGSTDATGAILERAAESEPRLRCLHRPPGSPGGKSAALNAGLALAGGDVIVVFDADHRPKPDVIARLVRSFEDPRVGAVQGRCEIRNVDDSAITQLIAIDYLAGYLANEYGRQSLFQLPAYGGANCAVRGSSIRALGGWNVDSVTEDTDLTLRLMLRGERVRYDPTAVDAEEAVPTLRRYWRQRYRWARGHQRVWRDYRRAVLRSRFLTPAQKVETFMFLLVFHVPIAVLAGIGVLVFWMTGVVQPLQPADLFVLWALLFLGPLSELGSGLLISRAKRSTAFAIALFLPLYLLLSILCTKALLDGLLGRGYVWHKTPRAGSFTPGVPV
jgi:cellulose synthase/poly-beta-1,6-N-acetylglucosamine synthase-like glycosyltransferase